MELVQRAKMQMPMRAMLRYWDNLFCGDAHGVNCFIRPGVIDQLERFRGQVPQPNRINPRASGLDEWLFGLV